MVKMSFSKQVLPHLSVINFTKPFLAIALILYPLKTPEAFWFRGIKWVHWPEMGRYKHVPNQCHMIIYNLI